MDAALDTETFNNPLIMRNLLQVFPSVGLPITETLSNIISEIGTASYFESLVETYAPLVSESGILPKAEVEKWIFGQNEAMNQGTFAT